MYFSYFMFFHCFWLYSRSYSLCFFLPVFSVSRLISYPNMLVYYFPLFFRILAIFQVLECVSHFPRFSVFPPQSRFYSMCFSFCTIFGVSRRILGLPCELLIFLFGQFSCHIPGSTVCNIHFSRFSVFLAIFQGIQCL